MLAVLLAQGDGLAPSADSATVLKDGAIVRNAEPLSRDALRQYFVLGRFHAPGTARVPGVRVSPALLLLGAPVDSLRGGGVAHGAARASPLMPEK